MIGLRVGLRNANSSAGLLAVSMTDSADPTPADANFTYTVGNTNSGPGTCSSLSCVVTLDASLTFVSSTHAGWGRSVNGQIITYTLATLGVAAATDIVITVTSGNATASITSSVATSGTNFATANASQGTSVVQPTVSDPLLDSADPVVTGTNFTYTSTYVNSGPGTVFGLLLTFTLDANTTWVSTTGTGWTLAHPTAHVVTATRASLAVGSANVITITVTAPASAMVLVTTLAATATNAATQNASAGPTVNLVAKDATSGIYLPATAAQWTSLGLTAPSSLYLCQDAATPLADAIGAVTLAAGGTGLSYQTAVSGWTQKATQTTNGTAGRWATTSATLPDLSTTSCLMLVYALPLTPGATRGGMNMGTTEAAIGFQTGPVTRHISGANATAGVGDPTLAVHPFVIKFDRTNTIQTNYSDLEKVSPTFSTLVTGKRWSLGGEGTITDQVQFLFAARWDGAAAEMSDATVKSMLQKLGWTIPWS